LGQHSSGRAMYRVNDGYVVFEEMLSPL
jgi:hypothetical protein